MARIDWITGLIAAALTPLHLMMFRIVARSA